MWIRPIVLTFAIGVLVAVAVLSSASDQTKHVSESRNIQADYSEVERIITGPSYSAEIDGAPGLPDARILVHTDVRVRRGGVVYLADDGSVLRTRSVGGRQALSVSSDGGAIAVLDITGIDEGAPNKLTVETASGEVLWERHDGFGRGEKGYAPVLVTSQGYAIVSPNIHPYGIASGNITQPLIFDPSGELVDELPARYVHGSMSVSKDGMYLAVSFADLDAEGEAAEGYEGMEPLARPCVGLYEIASGMEMWRHCFDYYGSHCKGGVVAVSRGAHRVICGGQDKGIRSLADTPAGWYSIYVFDRSGNVVSKNKVEHLFGSVMLSPGDRMAAVRVSSLGSDSLIAVGLEDGQIAYRWTYSEHQAYWCHVSSLGDSGTMAVEVTARSQPEGDARVRRWVLVDSKGNTVYEEPIDLGDEPLLLIGGGGRKLRKLTKGGLTEYAIHE